MFLRGSFRGDLMLLPKLMHCRMLQLCHSGFMELFTVYCLSLNITVLLVPLPSPGKGICTRNTTASLISQLTVEKKKLKAE